MDMDMVTMDTMARGLLRLSLDMVIMVMDMVLDMVMDMAMVTMDIMARDPLMLSLLPLLNQLLMPSQLLPLMPSLLPLPSPDMDMVMDMAMDILVMDMVVMDIMDIMARGLLMLSQAMDITVMDTVMDMAMDMGMDIMDIMARDLLSQVMDIMAMDMDMDMVMVMAMVMDTTAKQICYSFSEFSTNEVGPCGSSQNTHNFHLKENRYRE